MRFLIVTGVSGAGKSTALKRLEDIGFFCVDNMPIALFPKFAELAFAPEGEITRAALGIDIRSGRDLDGVEDGLQQLEKAGFSYEILFLDANDEVLIKRFKETRRAHPLAEEGRVDKSILKEREKLSFLKKRADYIIDSSQLLVRELNQQLDEMFLKDKEFKNLIITVLSFGFKHGIPIDSDLVFDVRFLPNPYYLDDLRPKTGNDKEVQDYVMSTEIAHEFLGKLTDMVDFLIPNYIKEGKNQLVISIGCTGGKHRSVTLANRLYEELAAKEEYHVKIEHRDIGR